MANVNLSFILIQYSQDLHLDNHKVNLMKGCKKNPHKQTNTQTNQQQQQQRPHKIYSNIT
jgi:hypothetical protein